MFDTQAPQSIQVMLPIERDRNNMPKDLVQGCRKRILLTSWVALCGRRSIREPVIAVTDLGTALMLETPKPAQLCKNISLTRFQKII